LKILEIDFVEKEEYFEYNFYYVTLYLLYKSSNLEGEIGVRKDEAC
jgi:hypothetical protein